jgi:hypothetical protein
VSEEIRMRDWAQAHNGVPRFKALAVDVTPLLLQGSLCGFWIQSYSWSCVSSLLVELSCEEASVDVLYFDVQVPRERRVQIGGAPLSASYVFPGAWRVPIGYHAGPHVPGLVDPVRL